MARLGIAFLALIVWLGVIMAGPALAASTEENDGGSSHVGLGEMVVTAEKMDQREQDVPASLSVFSGAELQDLQVETTAEMLGRIPNLYLNIIGPRGGFGMPMSLRGIASFMSGDPVLSILVDGVYTPTMDFTLLDVERVEVLRGPQGTLYGCNTEAGVVNIITKRPTEQWSGDLGLSYANYNTYGVDFAVGGAVAPEKLFLRAAGRYGKSDGFFTNLADGSDDVDKHEDFDGRLSLNWRATKELNLTLTGDFQHYDSNYAEFALLDQVMDGSHDVDVDYPGDAKKRAAGTALNVEWQIGQVRMVSITSFRDDDYSSSQDIDFTPYDIMRLDLSRDYQSTNQELRFVSDDPKAKFKWVAGVYAYVEDNNLDYTTQMRPMSGSTAHLRQKGDTHTRGTALFGQATYTLLGILDLTAGLRYDNQNKDFDYSWSGGAWGVPDESGSTDNDFSAWLPKFAVALRLDERFTPYVSVSRGYKSGGFNLKSSAGKSYDSEFAWNYEVGVKSLWFEDRLSINLAAFYIDWSELQVEQPDYPDFTVVNAASATCRGAELEISALLLPGLRVGGSVGFVDATFDDFVFGSENYAGNNVPTVPECTYRLALDYRFGGHYMLSAEYLGVGNINWDAANSHSQSGYEVVNAKAGYETGRLGLYLWAKNLFDESYATRAFEMSGQWYGRAADPLCFGVTAKISF